MLERDLQKEINQINGALQVLGLLHERLQLQLDELAAQSGQEAVDEVLSHVIAMRSEYLRRQQTLHPKHKSYLFYLVDSAVLPVDHDCYIALLRGEPVACKFFSRRLRLADWYVRMDDDKPQRVVNENYSWLVFDERGRLNLQAAHAVELSPLPDETERQQISRLLFAAD